MTLNHFWTDVASKELNDFLLGHGWVNNEDYSLYIGEVENPSFNGWQIVKDIQSGLDKTIVVPDFGDKYLSGILPLIEKSLVQQKWNELIDTEKGLFNSFFKSKLSSYGDFPLNDFLAFLSSWGDIFESNEREKLSQFLLESFDIKIHIESFETLQKNNNFLNYKRILRTHSKESGLFFCFTQDREFEAEEKLLLGLLVIYQDQQREKDTLEKYSKSDWEIILNSLNFPTCLISSKGELVIHNTHFSALGLYASDCLKLENNETIECLERFHKVLKSPLRIKGKEYFSYIFITEDSYALEGGLRISSEELGIISGSIAHELNNPIAGILAALTLLKLEDDLGEESENLINDMERGAKRCKKLIEVFLGFSKLDPTHSQIDTLENSAFQSLQLLRSRMVESNLKMIFDYKQKSSFSRNLNNSISSMIFYLILSEAFTLGHHQKLLSNDFSKIKIEVLEDLNEIKLSFHPFMKIYDVLSKSKLLLHLIGLLELEMYGEESLVVIKNLKYNT